MRPGQPLQTGVLVSPIWPTASRPEWGAFIQNLAREFRKAIGVDVIVPRSVARTVADRIRCARRLPAQPMDDGVLEPWFLSVSSSLPLPKRWAGEAHARNFAAAVQRGLGGLGRRPDFVHASFVESALGAWQWCRQHDVPLIVEFQESNLEGACHRCGMEEVRRAVSSARRVICVGKGNVAIASRLLCPPGPPPEYIPNGVDLVRYAPRDRVEQRIRLGLPQDRPLVAFTGHFIERKGPLRLLDALAQMPGIGGVFLGQGEQWPSGASVAHAGPVPNHELPAWLAACDVFVLPSLAEGLPNATLEALAMGLPVVVSDLPFNRDFLDPSCAVFVDPMSPKSIAQGIQTALADRDRMGVAARAKAREFSLQRRVERILGGVHGPRPSSNGLAR